MGQAEHERLTGCSATPSSSGCSRGCAGGSSSVSRSMAPSLADPPPLSAGRRSGCSAGHRARAARSACRCGAVDELVRRSGASPEDSRRRSSRSRGRSVRAEASAAEQLAWEPAFAPFGRRVPGARRWRTWIERVRAAGRGQALGGARPTGSRAARAVATVLAALPRPRRAAGRVRCAPCRWRARARRRRAARHTRARRRPGARRPPAPRPGRVAGRVASRGVGRRRIAVRRAFERRAHARAARRGGDGSGRILSAAGDRATCVADAASARARSAEVGGCSVSAACWWSRTPCRGARRRPLGAECLPLVCTSGQPGAATMLLLRALVAAGAQLAHHGDFDWGGVRLATCCTPGCRSSRGSSTPRRTYAPQSVTIASPLIGVRCRELGSALGEAMRRVGRRIEEELVADELLGELPEGLREVVLAGPAARVPGGAMADA